MDRHIYQSVAKKLSLKEIQVLIGIRRAGKSTIFKLLINQLMKSVAPKSILYINFDDPLYSPMLSDAATLYQIIEAAETLTDEKITYLFLDEIQNVIGWEKFVKSTYDSTLFKKIFITGSNSSLLASQYAKLLTGRYVADHVYPLSYQEILSTHRITSKLALVDQKTQAMQLFHQMLNYGGFPEIFKINDDSLKREVLLSYYEGIVLKDCLFNHTVRDVRGFRDLTQYLLTNNAVLFSYNSLAKQLNSNDNSTKQFVNIIQDSFLVDILQPFSFALGKQLRAKKKSYCCDNGLLNSVAPGFSDNRGRLLENLVYNELQKNGMTNIHYFNEKKECDFIFQHQNERYAMQVTYELNDRNRQREKAGLQLAMQQLDIKNGIILTANQTESPDKNVRVVPFYQFFSGLE